MKRLFLCWFIGDVERVKQKGKDFLFPSRGASTGLIPRSLLRKRWAELALRSIPFIFGLSTIIAGCTNLKQASGIYQPLNTSPIVPAVTTTAVINPDKSPTPAAAQPENSVPESTPPESVPSDPPAPIANRAVPFTSQAPFAVWDELHGEACEEASLIMAMAYFRNFALTPHTAEQEILNVVDWQTQQGYAVDLTAKETKEVAEQYYQLTAELVYKVNVETIKRELDAGKLVILPLAGREIGNPYFQTPGPIYHMLVVTGYDDDEFITNDPGTKRGENYHYQFATLINAIHDWDHQRAIGGMTDEEIVQGQPVMVVISDR